MNPFEFMKGDLQLNYLAGIDTAQQPIFKTTTYRGIKENVSSVQLQTVAQALASLSEYPLSSVNYLRKESAIV